MLAKSTAVITAGGYATRCQGMTPKALIRANSIPYIEALLIEVLKSGITDIVIYCNRPEYLGDIERIASRYCKPAIVIDNGVASTFQLARHAANLCIEKNIVFMYGHSPRPSTHLRAIIDTPDTDQLVVTLFKGSSKRKPIRWSDDQYVEPPYKISATLLKNSKHEDWVSFFNSFTNTLKGVPLKAPPEFNNLAEKKEFERYLHTWFRRVPKAAVQQPRASLALPIAASQLC